MRKDTDFAREKHAKQYPKHAIAFVLRAQWVKDNDGKTLNDWNHNVHLEEMMTKYSVEWIEDEQPSMMRFMVKKSSVSSRMTLEEFSKKKDLKVEFLLCASEESKTSHSVISDSRTSFLDNFMAIDSNLSNKDPGSIRNF